MATLLALGTRLVAAPLNPNDDWAATGPVHPARKVGDMLPPLVRAPQFPLKDKRTLYTDEEIAQARANVKKYPAAKAVADKIIGEAAYWVDWTDEALRDVIPTADVPRAFEVCPEGCPVHGKKIFEGTKKFYPWIVDPKKPFTVTCPIGGETYPSNDYAAFYKSGCKDRSLLTGPYADDGRGWVGPNGQRYWFVAHANHFLWYAHESSPHPNIMDGLAALGRAYLLTGEARYAHKAAVLLRRIADVYPNMDHESQSRYGQLMAEKDGSRYSGKILNAIWETYLVAQFGETYDAIWPTIDGDTALQKFYGNDGPTLRARIEANILEDGIDAFYEKRVRGNYGMHQRALLLLAVVRQHGDNQRYLADVLDRPEGSVYLGLKPALNTLVWRDGQPFESPGYNLTWVQNLNELTKLLPKLGVDISTLPRLRRVYDAPLNSIVIGRHTPAIGDSTSVYGGVIGEDVSVYQQAYRTYHDPRYAQFLTGFGAGGDKGFKDFSSLLYPPVESTSMPTAGRRLAPQPSRLLSGFGLGILNNAADDTGVSLYYGQHVNHRHFDRLHFDLFANGQPMTPDLGYPDAMNEFVSSIYTWSIHTISHNTVTVDATPQPGNVPGVVQLMAEDAGVRVLDVDAAGTYPQCSVYRRAVVLVDVSPQQSYLVDFFNVTGGHEHVYSLHGPPGSFALEGGKWTPPGKGTLAGENVPLGQIYDDPVLGAPGYKGGYSEYRGSGYQHFIGVQHHEGEPWAALYTHEKNPAAKLRLRVTDQTDQDLILAEAKVSPLKYPQQIHYVLARRKAAEGQNLASTFVSVLEPYAETPPLGEIARLDLGKGTAAVTIQRADGRTDVVFHGLDASGRKFSAAGHLLEVAATTMAATFDAGGQLERLFFAGGEGVVIDGQRHTAPKAMAGHVVRVDPRTESIAVELEAGGTADIVGRVANFTSATGRTAHTIAAAKLTGRELILSPHDDVLVGLMHVTAAEGGVLHTRARLTFAPSYVGATALDANFQPLGTVRAAAEDRVELLKAPVGDGAQPGRDVWLSSVGPGDTFELPSVYAWTRADVDARTQGRQ